MALLQRPKAPKASPRERAASEASISAALVSGQDYGRQLRSFELADFMTAEQRSKHMAKIKSKNTKPELQLRRELHALGFRYRLHGARLPGRPDLIFPGRRKVIFVHGCFWHGHSCPIGSRLPKTNTEFWRDKRSKNEQRDARQLEELQQLGWEPLVVWECQVKTGAALTAAQAFLSG